MLQFDEILNELRKMGPPGRRFSADVGGGYGF